MALTCHGTTTRATTTRAGDVIIFLVDAACALICIGWISLIALTPSATLAYIERSYLLIGLAVVCLATWLFGLRSGLVFSMGILVTAYLIHTVIQIDDCPSGFTLIKTECLDEAWLKDLEDTAMKIQGMESEIKDAVDEQGRLEVQFADVNRGYENMNWAIPKLTTSLAELSRGESRDETIQKIKKKHKMLYQEQLTKEALLEPMVLKRKRLESQRESKQVRPQTPLIRQLVDYVIPRPKQTDLMYHRTEIMIAGGVILVIPITLTMDLRAPRMDPRTSGYSSPRYSYSTTPKCPISFS